MPYIVTTKRPDALDAAHRRLGLATVAESVRVVSRRAVATLEEARKIAADLGRAHLAKDDPAVAPWLAAGILRLPESGGTVGPLPDGTVIEVEQIYWPELAVAAQWDGTPEGAEPHEAGRAILDAFNARESSQ